MRLNREIIAITVALALGIVIGIAIEEKLASFALKDFGPILATLTAAFLGAHYAFALNRQKDDEKLKREQLAAGNRAIFSLAMQANKLWLYQNQVIDPYRLAADQSLAMPPVAVTDSDLIPIDIDSLAFLIERGRAELLGKIATAGSKYDAAIAAIKRRSDTHMREAQPRLEQAGNSFRNFDEATRILGPRISKTLKMGTDQLIEQVDAARPYIEEIGNELNGALREIFPGRLVIAFHLPISHQ